MDDDAYPPVGNMDPECHGISQARHDDPNDPAYDPPCPRCHRREGAFEDGRCTPCGYEREES